MNIKFYIAVFIFAISTNQLFADTANTNQHKTVDGISIYLGVIPAEIIEGPKAISMHGGLPVGQFRYHMIVALFNEQNKRLDNARISVRVSTQKNKTEVQTLEKMKFHNKLVYGNYFSFPEPGPYRIEVTIQHPKYIKSIRAEFKYQISHASLELGTQFIN